MIVSVAIPAYKKEFLESCIQSVLNQTFGDFELIIVDDCSPHKLGGIVDKFSDSRIKFYRNEKNLGAEDPSMNWNICLKHAHGDFFCLLCDDDIYEPTFLEEMIQLAKSHPKCNVFRARAEIINEKGSIIDYYPSSPLWESCEDYIWHVGRKLRKQTISEWMFRTSHIRKCGGYSNLPFAWGADYLSIYRFCIDGGIVSTTKLLVAYRRSSMNISTLAHKDSKMKLWANKQFEEQVYILIAQNNLSPKLKNEVIRHKTIADTYILSRISLWRLILQIFLRKKYGISKKAFLKGFEEKLYLMIKGK